MPQTSGTDSPNAKYGRRSQPPSPPTNAPPIYAAAPNRAASPGSASRLASLQQLKQGRAPGVPPGGLQYSGG